MLWATQARGLSIQESSCHQAIESKSVAVAPSSSRTAAATTAAYACGSPHRTSCRQVGGARPRSLSSDARPSTWSRSATAGRTLQPTSSQPARAATTRGTGCTSRPSRRRTASMLPSWSRSGVGIRGGCTRWGWLNDKSGRPSAPRMSTSRVRHVLSKFVGDVVRHLPLDSLFLLELLNGPLL